MLYTCIHESQTGISATLTDISCNIFFSPFSKYRNSSSIRRNRLLQTNSSSLLVIHSNRRRCVASTLIE
jgi:hypothetical protein